MCYKCDSDVLHTVMLGSSDIQLRLRWIILIVPEELLLIETALENARGKETVLTIY